MAVTRVKPLQSAVLATGNGDTIDLQGATSVNVQVLLAGTATVTFEVSIDKTNWVPLYMESYSATASAVTSTTVNGIWYADIRGLALFRARVSSWTSGAVTATASSYTVE